MAKRTNPARPKRSSGTNYRETRRPAKPEPIKKAAVKTEPYKAPKSDG
jgi:hypothetical protein